MAIPDYTKSNILCQRMSSPLLPHVPHPLYIPRQVQIYSQEQAALKGNAACGIGSTGPRSVLHHDSPYWNNSPFCQSGNRTVATAGRPPDEHPLAHQLPRPKLPVQSSPPIIPADHMPNNLPNDCNLPNNFQSHLQPTPPSLIALATPPVHPYPQKHPSTPESDP